MLLERVEFLGDKDGRKYKINGDDERKIIEKETMKHMGEFEKERVIEKAIDSFEEGYNKLEKISGEWFEVYEDYHLRIERKAYL